MSKAAKQIPRQIDIQALEQLVEPLTVAVARVVNGNFSPIVLPNGESGMPGVGWSKDEIMSIEGWLLNHWSGGGMYEITVTDSTQPTPQKLAWRPFWPTSDYPQKTPPTMIDSAAPRPAAQPVQLQPVQQQVPMMTQFPNGLPGGGISYYQQPVHAPMYAPPPPPQNTNYNPYLQQAEADRRRLEERLSATEAALQRANFESQQRGYQADLERERAANAQAMQRLEQRLAEMQKAPSGPDPAVIAANAALEAAKEQARQAEARAEREARERAEERRAQEAREAVQRSEENTRRMIEQMQTQMREMQALVIAQQNRGPDPMFQMMMEQNRNQMEAMKEISRQSTAQMDKYQTFMMSPRDVMQMQRDQSNGLDTVSEKLTKVYGNVLEMHQKVLENALQLNQGGNDTVGLIRDGISAAKEGFERYIGVKSKAEQVKAQAAAQTATAQAQAQAIDAQARVEVARAHNMPQPIQVPTPPRQQPSQGLGNAQAKPASGSSFAEWRAQHEAATAATQAAHAAGTVSPSGQHVPTPGNGVQTAAPTATTTPPQTVPLRRGRTDAEWFGPTLGEVLQVREAVQTFLAGLAHGKFEGATPQAVADGIAQAHALVMMNGIPVPAMTELINNGLYDEFLEVLLPDVPSTFHDDVLKLVQDKFGDLDDDDDDDDDQDDDEDVDGEQHDHDDVRDGTVEKPKQKGVRIITNPARA